MTRKSKAILIGVSTADDNEEDIIQELEELNQLATTLGYSVIKTFLQKRTAIDTGTYVGKGKINSIINISAELNAGTLIFNNELKPSHFKNINKLINDDFVIIDRTKVILDIFAKHAKTKESKTQIALAANQYALPRLKGLWTHLERQMGGIGTRGGPGEKQIEIDRRIIGKQITKLKKDLKAIENSRNNMRKNRDSIYKICIVGYTNAGKSSLMQELTGFQTYIKNELFATLDTTTKRTTLRKKYNLLISDTVGFLNNLPHALIASFRSTLEEINTADLIIKLIDISTPNIDKHIQTINDTLHIIGADNKKFITVFNKTDLVNDKTIFNQIKNTHKQSIMISTTHKLKVNSLIDEIISHIDSQMNQYILEIPYSKYDIVNHIYKDMIVLEETGEDTIVKLKIKCTKIQFESIHFKLKNP